MSSKRKNVNTDEVKVENQENTTPVVEQVIEPQEEIKNEPEKVEKSKNEPKEKVNSNQEKQKFKIGSIVFVSKDAEADLNGFKLFPQYKKYTYTVEAYEPKSGVYTLRRLNLSLRLTEDLIMAPNEKSGSELYKKQF